MQVTIEELKKLLSVVKLARHDTILPSKYPDNHVFDMDKSVRWNREKVEKENAAREQKLKERKEQLQKTEKEFEDALKCFLLNDENYGRGKLSEKQLTKIQHFMYEWQENTYNMEYGLEMYLTLAQDLINIVIDD